MRFLHEAHDRQLELSYPDVFIVQQHNDTFASRLEADLTPLGNTGLMMPLVGANMNSLAGKRFCEDLARFGGIGFLTQDMDMEHIQRAVNHVKGVDPRYEAALTIAEDTSIKEAMSLMWKRSYMGAVVMRREAPVGVLTMEQCKSEQAQEYDVAGDIMPKDLVTMPKDLSPEDMYGWFTGTGPRIYPVVDNGELLGIMTRQAAFDLINFKPAVDGQNRLKIGATVGINGDPAGKAEQLMELGVDMLVLDTANGGLELMMQSVKKVRRVIDRSGLNVPLAAGNVMTGELATMLFDRGANIVKVGVGPGAMCTTRMMTGVGRPQFSAVLDCAETLREVSGDTAFVWADGGIEYPRDVALALAAGAQAVMIGTLFVGTHESAGDVEFDDGGAFVATHGMASRTAVINREGDGLSPIDRAQRRRFSEGASDGKRYLKPGQDSVSLIVNQVDSGLRSTRSYANAKTAEEYRDRVIVGVQSPAGYVEGKSKARI